MKLILKERKEVVPGVETFVFSPDAPLEWRAGQYLHYVLPHEADERGGERWFTVSSAPYEGTPAITTRHAAERGSSFKEKLFTLKPGDTIEADGPEGDFVVEDTAAHYVFLAGGIGITPFHSILKEADHAGQKLNVTLLYANRGDAPFKPELDEWAGRNPNLHVHYLTGLLDKASIEKIVQDTATPIFYVSGPEPMVKSVAEVLGTLGVPAQHIKLDDFPGYEQY